ncbi:hypothetical protein [Thioalkalivibrio sp. K90mix]|uniref:hypothetical protein n=1 Tax=Thioalkalivibrio sp. (strain K90mix) TaxID=396595 RepID=UPI001FCA8C03|nr:hypothetical protein [Thioalkalivibrio sp. K90mix]
MQRSTWKVVAATAITLTLSACGPSLSPEAQEVEGSLTERQLELLERSADRRGLTREEALEQMAEDYAEMEQRFGNLSDQF